MNPAFGTALWGAQVVVYSARLVIPVTAPVIPNGSVAVYEGRVINIGTREWVIATLKEEFGPRLRLVERHWDGIMTPGLVNAHTHLQYTNMASVGAGDYADFRGWELGFNKVYDALVREPASIWRDSADQGARMLVEAGTTAAADVVTNIEAIGALRSQGLRGVAYWEIMDWSNEQWRAEGKRRLVERLTAISDMGLESVGISPHAPYSLESEPFLDMPDIARRVGMRLHIHLGETPLERGTRPADLTTYTGVEWQNNEWQSYRDLKKHGFGASAIQFVDQLGALGPDVHIAHGVYADKEDRRLLRQRGVSVALCPRSNRITSTMSEAPIADYLREGNLVSIGTDSLSSSPSLDVLDDCSELFDLARAQGYDQADLSHRLIRMLTLGGAEAMGLNVGPDRIGQINAGARADLAFFDVSTDVLSPGGIEETLERFVRDGGGSNRATVISGRLVYNDAAFEDIETSPAEQSVEDEK
ncbi:MAG: amidohydrolase family protein [Bifidobacteriaceae bacterium]|jgi:cytosine/adenosine deaminase-related metal-dependent hydrolase|nr:amidohydrolase family protein [Bifidobacteriaceae bacterium]MCI1914535.1 amidohydrolase family protein [Bifidobacteriaceae bacterium]